MPGYNVHLTTCGPRGVGELIKNEFDPGHEREFFAQSRKPRQSEFVQLTSWSSLQIYQFIIHVHQSIADSGPQLPHPWDFKAGNFKLCLNGQQKHATCFATLLQNKLNSDVSTFNTQVQTYQQPRDQKFLLIFLSIQFTTGSSKTHCEAPDCRSSKEKLSLLLIAPSCQHSLTRS